VDIYSTDVGQTNYEKTLANVSPWKDRVDIRKGWSTEVATSVPDASASFIFIDAGHTYAEIMDDLNAYWSKLAVGGILAGDDYVDGWVEDAQYTFGVKSAVDDFAREKSSRVYMTTQKEMRSGLPVPNVPQHASWYIFKCSE